jgi:hypothetical protein
MFPPYRDFLWIESERGRIISFVAAPHGKSGELIHYPVRIWFAVTSPGTVRFRITPDGEWSDSGFRFEDNRLIWTTRGTDLEFDPGLPAEAPKWLQSKVAATYSRMDELERKAAAQSGADSSPGEPGPS